MATVSVDANAALGTRDATVTNPAAGPTPAKSDTLPAAFE